MGSRILHELSQEVVILLETGLRGHDGRQIPVFFCHPLDPFGDQRDPTEGTFGILYMTRIVPDLNLRQSGIEGVLRWRPDLIQQIHYLFRRLGHSVIEHVVSVTLEPQEPGFHRP